MKEWIEDAEKSGVCGLIGYRIKVLGDSNYGKDTRRIERA